MSAPQTGVSVAAEPLREAVAAIFQADGADADLARDLAESLVDSDLRDHASHGVFRVGEYHEAVITRQVDPAARPSLVRDDGTTITVDGARSYGLPALRFTTELAMERATEHGVCVAALRGGGHVGRLAPYVATVARRGLIGMLMTNDSGAGQVVAPHHGSDGRLGTNPLAFGIPRPQPPDLVFDMATSTTSSGAARIEARWAGVHQPQVALQPVAGHKGYGLALAIEVFAGILTGAGFSGPEPGPDHQGACLIVIDPDRFGGRANLAASVEELVGWVTASPPSGAEPVQVPGEPGERASRDRQTVVIDPVTWSELCGLLDAAGVPLPLHDAAFMRTAQPDA